MNAPILRDGYTMVGIAITYFSLKLNLITFVTNKIFVLKSSLPKTFYAFASVLAFQFATMFNSVRAFISATINYIQVFI